MYFKHDFPSELRRMLDLTQNCSGHLLLTLMLRFRLGAQECGVHHAAVPAHA